MGDPRTRLFGQKIHQDSEWGFAFWRPLNWKRLDLTEQHGVVYYPEHDPQTGFYVLTRAFGAELNEAIGEADLPALYEGVVEGLHKLPGCRVLDEKEIAKESAIGFEFLLTWSLKKDAAKRRMRFLYKDRQQITLYGQGVPASEYDLFANIFDWMYLTFTFEDLAEQVAEMYPDPHSPPEAQP